MTLDGKTPRGLLLLFVATTLGSSAITAVFVAVVAWMWLRLGILAFLPNSRALGVITAALALLFFVVGEGILIGVCRMAIRSTTADGVHQTGTVRLPVVVSLQALTVIGAISLAATETSPLVAIPSFIVAPIALTAAVTGALLFIEVNRNERRTRMPSGVSNDKASS